MKLAYHSNILNAVQFYRNVKHCPIDHEDSVTKALVYKRGLPYKRVVIGNDLEQLHLLSPDIKSFYAKSAELYVIPIDDLLCIRGFLFRSVYGKGV